MLHGPSTEHGTDRRGNRGEGGPGTDRSAPFFRGEGDADQGEASGHEKSSADALKRACEDKLVNARRKTAPRRSSGEESHSNGKHLAPAIEVAERSAGEKQRGKHERVGFDDPLHFVDRRV